MAVALSSWLHEHETWAVWLTGAGTSVLALGVLIAIVQLHALKRDRHLQWIFEIGRRWDEDKLEAARVKLRTLDDHDGEILAAKTRAWLDRDRPYDETLDAELTCLSRLPDFFEDAALMARYGRLDIGLVWQSLSGPVNSAWKGWAHAIDVYRENADKEAYTEFEDLRRQLLRYERLRTRRWFRAYRWLRWYVW